MKYTLYLTLLLFISCKTKVSENFNDITLKPTQKELINKYYKYDFKGIRDFKKIVGEKTKITLIKEEAADWKPDD